ncbi:MAG: hypothetical protein ROO71_07165 [Balneola sp.]
MIIYIKYFSVFLSFILVFSQDIFSQKNELDNAEAYQVIKNIEDLKKLELVRDLVNYGYKHDSALSIINAVQIIRNITGPNKINIVPPSKYLSFENIDHSSFKRVVIKQDSLIPYIDRIKLLDFAREILEKEDAIDSSMIDILLREEFFISNFIEGINREIYEESKTTSNYIISFSRQEISDIIFNYKKRNLIVNKGVLFLDSIYGEYKIPANDTTILEWEFQKDKIEILFKGDGDTDLDFYVYDYKGDLIASNTKSNDVAYFKSILNNRKVYLIKIINKGSVYNTCIVSSN